MKGSSSPPEHWTHYTGPAAWYSIWFPPNWKLNESGGFLSLEAPQGGGALTIRCFWVDDASQATADELIDLDELFPERRNVRPLKALDVAVDTLGFEGEVLFRPAKTESWWQNLWVAKTWRKWRVWSLRQKSLGLLALYVQADQYDPESETMVRMILNTLELSEFPADPPDKFADRVLELAREKFPLLDCEPGPEFQLKLGESSVNLFNFYRSYLHAPDQFEEIVLPALTTVVQVQGWGKEQLEPSLEQVRDRILPMLYPESVWRERFSNFVGSPWVADLMVLYVVDESRAYWYIRDDLLEKWGITLDELNEIALTNLERYFRESPMEFTLAGEQGDSQLLFPVRADAYNASRLLSPEFQAKLREVLGNELAAGIPSRDFFVAVSMHSDAAIRKVRHKISEDFQQMDHPLSDRILLVTHDGVSEYPIQ